MSQQQEYILQVQITDWLRLQHPDIPFRSDLGGIRLPISLAKKAKRIQKGPGWPDLFLPIPRAHYHGMFTELKYSRGEVYTKKGEMRQEEHILTQAAILKQLCDLGYYAVWGFGFDETIELIGGYLRLK